MKIYMFMISIFSFYSLFSCNKPCSAEAMKSFSYSIQGMQMYGESFFVVRSGSNVEVEITFYQEPFKIQTDTNIFVDLQAIVDKYNVSSYKKRYQTKFDICDGQSWSLNISYANPKCNIRSGGSNAWPRRGGEALHEFRNYFLRRFLPSEL